MAGKSRGFQETRSGVRGFMVLGGRDRFRPSPLQAKAALRLGLFKVKMLLAPSAGGPNP